LESSLLNFGIDSNAKNLVAIPAHFQINVKRTWEKKTMHKVWKSHSQLLGEEGEDGDVF